MTVFPRFATWPPSLSLFHPVADAAAEPRCSGAASTAGSGDAELRGRQRERHSSRCQKERGTVRGQRFCIQKAPLPRPPPAGEKPTGSPSAPCRPPRADAVRRDGAARTSRPPSSPRGMAVAAAARGTLPEAPTPAPQLFPYRAPGRAPYSPLSPSSSSTSSSSSSSSRSSSTSGFSACIAPFPLPPPPRALPFCPGRPARIQAAARPRLRGGAGRRGRLGTFPEALGGIGLSVPGARSRSAAGRRCVSPLRSRSQCLADTCQRATSRARGRRRLARLSVFGRQRIRE